MPVIGHRNSLKQFRRCALLAGAMGLATALSAPGYSPIGPTAADSAVNAGLELAERLSDLARENLRTELSAPLLRESAALLQAAAHEDPKDDRYPRLLGIAMGQLGETAGEIDAWNQYVRVVAAGGGEDRLAQAHIIDLYLSRIQTVDGQLVYLTDVIARQAIPAEVRSHAACAAIALLLERSPTEAAAMAEKAVKLYPLPEAVGYHYQLIDSKGSAPERIAGLLAMLKANPTQGLAVQALAREIAEAGLAQESLEWYAAALSILNRSNSFPSHDFATQYVAELMLAGQGRAAQGVISRLLELQQADPDYWFLKLTLDRASHQQVSLSQSLVLARDLFVRRWATLNAQIMGTEPPPAPDPKTGAAAAPITAPDPAAAVAKLKDPSAADYVPAFNAVMNDLSWLELYYANRPDAAAPWIDALQAVAGAKDASVRRLQGWHAMESGKIKEARTIFEHTANDDPLSAIGLVRLDESEKLTADAEALRQRTLRRYPAGVFAAILHEALVPNLTLDVDAPVGSPATQPAADLGKAPDAQPLATGTGKVPAGATAGAVALKSAPRTGAGAATAPTSAPVVAKPAGAATRPSLLAAKATTAPATQPSVVDVIRAELEAFPRGWMGLVDQPQSVYSVTADPIRSSHRFGDALLARVTVRNLSNNDLFIGPQGTIRPQVLFDAVIRGVAQQNFPGVTLDELTGALVLPPRGIINQVVRLDQGDLTDALAERPSASIQVTGLVTTNPQMVTDGIAPGPAGYRMPFTRNFFRMATDLKTPAARKKIYDAIDSGDTGEKMQNLQLLGSYVQSISQDGDPAVRAAATEILQVIVKARGDSVPEVAAWAGYLAATVHGVDGQEQIVREMLKDKFWAARLLGLVASRTLSTELQKQSAAELAQGDAEPIVKSYAVAMTEVLQHPTSGPSKPTGRNAQGPAIDSGASPDDSGSK